MKTVHIKITGKVQGVFFRATAREIANIHQLKGWVKNTIDKAVEIMISGNPSAIDSFLEWCKQGPERAFVDEVIVTELPLKKFDSFEILR